MWHGSATASGPTTFLPGSCRNKAALEGRSHHRSSHRPRVHTGNDHQLGPSRGVDSGAGRGRSLPSRQGPSREIPTQKSPRLATDRCGPGSRKGSSGSTAENMWSSFDLRVLRPAEDPLRRAEPLRWWWWWWYLEGQEEERGQGQDEERGQGRDAPPTHTCRGRPQPRAREAPRSKNGNGRTGAPHRHWHKSVVTTAPVTTALGQPCRHGSRAVVTAPNGANGGGTTVGAAVACPPRRRLPRSRPACAAKTRRGRRGQPPRPRRLGRCCLTVAGQ